MKYMPTVNYWEEPADGEVAEKPAGNKARPKYMPTVNYWDEPADDEPARNTEPAEPARQPMEVDVGECGRMRRRVGNEGVLEVPAEVVEAACTAEKATASVLSASRTTMTTQRLTTPKYAPPVNYWEAP